ncbi:hypothetical protein J2Z31_003158 [Sinorhizobium kostiense]|uniref:Uncharacterized protein n=1 Tax=Sinorhizobium kostiense TaxID=76747 RepID=A0ABS4R1T5_9HYPH|nr:hypothetical protein [Sinorhizobium kostiense]MBP2236644.1 hypothetical protein [Sinorhizobium kostiense]
MKYSINLPLDQIPKVQPLVISFHSRACSGPISYLFQVKMKAKKCAIGGFFRDKIDLAHLQPAKVKKNAAFACEMINLEPKKCKMAAVASFHDMQTAHCRTWFLPLWRSKRKSAEARLMAAGLTPRGA